MDHAEVTNFPSDTVRPRALVVDDDRVGQIKLKKLLSVCGYDVSLSQNGAEGVARFASDRPDIVFMDMLMPVMDGLEATKQIKTLCGEDFIPVIFVTGNSLEEDLARCIAAGGDDFLVKPYNRTVLAAKIQAMERISDLYRRNAELRTRMLEEQELAKTILECAVMGPNVRPAALKFFLEPATTFNGDILLSAYSPTGDLHVMLGDFTGHGLAATIGALPVSETFRAMTAKGFTPVQILREINRKLRTILPTGKFLAAVFLSVDRSLNRVSILNCGMPEAWLIHDGLVDASFTSSSLPLGVVGDDEFDAAEITLPVSRGDRIVLVSDGAIETENFDGAALGVDRLRRAYESGMNLHEPTEPADPLAASIRAIQVFRNGHPSADDASLIDIELSEALFGHGDVGMLSGPAPLAGVPDAASGIGGATRNAISPAPASLDWRVSLDVRGRTLRETSPVPLLISMLKEFPGLSSKGAVLFTVLSELYNNALDHGLLKLDSTLKEKDFATYLHERESRLEGLGEGLITLSVGCGYRGKDVNLEILVGDSGAGFNPALLPPPREDAPHGRGLRLVRGLCNSLEFNTAGTQAIATHAWAIEGGCQI